MRYEDTSGAFQASGPVANDDQDTLTAGQRGPATGNLITGEGTQYGSAGADSAAGGHITGIAGQGGEDGSFAGGKLSVTGAYGQLSVDAEGNYSYLANKGAPENVRDRFTYTLADNQGNTDTAALIVEIGKTPAVIKANATQIVPGPDGVVTLPPGVELSDIMVVGRNLVVNMPDGTQLIIIDGAVFVPQLSLGGVDVPASNVAALLIGQEPQPAAGELPPSSGGNFALPPPPLDPGVPLGDLIPPTEYTYKPPEPQETFPIENKLPIDFGNLDILIDDDTLPFGLAGGPGDGPDAVNIHASLSSLSLADIGGDGPLTFSLEMTGAPAGFALVSGGPGIALLTQNGVTVRTITFDPATGQYDVTQNAPILHPAGGEENNLVFVLTVTATDQDGDTAHGTITITYNDDTPEATNAQVGGTVDEDGVPGGIPGGTDDVAGENTVVNGSVTGLFLAGADGPLTYGLSSNTSGLPSLTSHGVAVTYAVAGDTLTASAGGTAVFTLVVHADGSYTFTLLDQLDHATLNGQAGDDTENDLSLALGSVVQATDADGDPVTAPANGLVIVVDDDTPLIGRADISAPTLTVDESNLAQNASGDFSVLFNGNVGADAPGAMHFAVSTVNGTDSGLVDVATGQSILLFNNNGVVEGHVGSQNGALAFTVSVNGATGVVALDQVRAVEHPDTSNPDDAVSPNAGSIQLVASMVDADGDAASLTVNIGQNMVFEDDGPSVTPTGAEPQLIVDESNLTINNTQNFGDAFNEVFGADGPDGSGVAYSLGINAGATGIFDTATGLEVVLTLEGGTVVGRAGAGGSVVFVISVNAAGDVTVDQQRAVIHPDTTNPDDSINIANDNLITLSATVTDGDGDTASATIGIGNNVHLEDDGPSANNDTDTTSGGVATGNVITGVDTTEGAANADDPGEDGFGSITNLVGFNGSSDNDSSGGFTVNGQFGSLQMDADGNYTYTKDAQAGGGGTETFTYTYVDGDGDPATATLTINIPNLTPVLPDPDAVLLDDDALAGGNPGGTGDNVDSQGTPGQLNGSGGDGDLDYNFTGDDTLPTGFTTSLQLNGDLWIMQGTTHVLTVTLDHETGVFSVAQVNPINHPAGLDENNLQFSIGVEVEDVDGDTEGAHITINVDDDTPIATEGQVTGTVDEDGVPGGIAGGPNDVAGTATVANGSVSSLFSAGADVPLTYSLSANTGGLPALSSGGVALVYNVAGNTLTATAGNGGPVVFTFQLQADGSWTFTLNDQLDHPTLNGLPGDNTENDLTIALGSIIVATDNDGDSVTANANGLVITVDDDTPVAVNDTDNVGAPGTTATGNVITDAAAGDAGDSDNGADSVGADAPGSITAIASINVPANLDTDAGPNFQINGQYGVLVLNADGSYTYTRNGGTPGGVQDAFTYTLTDADGDSTTATLTITLADNRPVATTSAATVDDEGLAGGIVGGSGDLDANVGETTPSASEAIYNGTLGGSPGDGPTVFLFEASLTGTTASVGTETVEYTVSGGGTLLTATVDGGARDGIVLFTVQITNTTTGAYTLTLQDNVLHPSLDGVAGDNTENDASVVIPYQMMDTDGDLSLAAGQLTVTFDDDIPTATANQLTGTVDEDGVLEGAADNGAGDGIAGGTGDVAGQNVSATGSVTTLFNSGADSPLAYSLLNNFAALTAQGLTSGGTALSYSVGLVAGVYTLTATAGPGGYTVFTFTLNASTGAYNFTLVDQMDHLSGNNENDLTVNLSSIIQATDADGDSVGSGANGLIITVDDDSPIATATQLTGTVDEDGVVENVSVGIQKGDGVPGGTGDVAGEVVSATGNVGTLFQSGADEPLSYQMLNSFAALTAQGLTSGGTALSYSVQLAGGVYTLTATAGPGGNTVFTFTLNAATGAYNFTLVDQLDHPTLNGLTGDNTENDLAINLSSIIQATDFDGDSVGAGANGLVITVDDDMPVINSVTTPLQVDNDATPSATGNFDFDIGADENSDNDDIAVSNFTVSVNGVALDPSDFTLTPGVENATTASYTFTFDYDTGTGGETTATGTLVFDKVAGTYTVTLTNGPIEGFSLLATGSADASDFVSYQVPAGGSGSPEVTVAALDTDFFVQFSGVAEPGSGTGADNLTTTTGAGGAFVPVTTASFGGLELFTQAMASIVVSSTAAGVGGNTIQGGEVLDLNLYATDPGGTLGGVPTQTSTSMFVALDGIGGAEDMIVVLKLYDTVTGQYTTKAIIVQNADILVQADAASLVGTPYEGLGAALDNNDGLIVFEPNDYQEGNTNLVIVGAQIAGSDEGITGTGINLNGDVGVSGGSIGTQAFSTDVSDAPFKITSIGFLTTSSEDQSAQIGFDVTIEDYDGDALTQHIDVNIGSSSPALLPPDPQGFASTLSTESSSLLVSNDNERSGGPGNTGKNVGDTGIMAGIVAAAGLMSDAAAAQDAADSGSDQGSELAYSYTAQTVETISAGDDSDSSSVSPLAAEPQAEDSAPAQSSSSSDDQANSSHGVDKGSAPAASDASDHASSDDHGPAAAADNTSPVAPTVAMVSAEALEAAKAGVDANAQHGGSVEQIVADALGQGDAPTVDAALANLPGGNGELSALATIASPAGAAVSGWDMGGQGAIGTIHDMMLSMHAPGMHHDAVQPAVNG